MFDRMTFFLDYSWFDLPNGVQKVVALVSNNMGNRKVVLQDVARAWKVEKSVAKQWIDEGVRLEVISINEYGELSAHAFEPKTA